MTTTDPQPCLAAIDFSRDIARLTQDFTGRDWLFDELEQWLHRGDQRFFILTGEPGVGKNTFVARLTQVGEHVAAHHFCVAGRSSTVVPGAVFRSLAAQLVDSLPGYDQALVNTIQPEYLSIEVDVDVRHLAGGQVKGVVIENLYAPNPRQVMDVLLRAPLAEMDAPSSMMGSAAAPPDPCFILIGALDAAVAYGGEANLVRLLAELDDLPPWVRFVCSSRPDRRVLRHFNMKGPHLPSSARFELDASSDENLADVRQYVERRSQGDDLRACLQAAAVPPQALADRLVELSAGNFLYTRIVLDGIVSGQQSLDNLDALPPGLDTVYHTFLRSFAADEWEERYQPVFGVLAVAQEPVTEDRLAHFTGLRRTRVRQDLGRLRQFLDVVPGEVEGKTYALFHRSLRDYLVDGERNEDFWCAPEDGHQSILDHYWRDGRPDWSACDDYGLRHALTHLVGAARWDLLAEVLPDFDFWETQTTRVGLDRVLVGLADVARKAPVRGDLCAQVSGLLRVLDREAHNLRGWDPGRRPPFFAQQVRNRALDEGIDHLVAGAEARLSQLRRSHLSLAWRTRRESTSLARTLVGHSRYVMAVAVTRDGWAVSGSADGTLKVWDLVTGRLLRTLAGHEESVRDVAVTPDGRRAISASFDATLKVWDVEAGQPVLNLAGHEGAVRAVALTLDGDRAVSGSEDCTLIVWDLETGDVVHRLAGHRRAIWDVAVTDDGRWAVSVADDGQLIVWDLGSGGSVYTEAVAKRGLRAVALVPGTHRAIVGAKSGALTIWDVDESQQAGMLAESGSSVFAVAVTPEGQTAISATSDKMLHVWDLDTGALAQTLAGHDGRVWDVAITPDGRWAVSAADDATLKVWDIQRGAVDQSARLRAGHAATVRTIALTPDEHVAVSAAADGQLIVWDAATGRLLHRMCGDAPAVRWGHGAAVLPDGQRCISATADTVLTVWDLESGEAVRRLTRPLAEGESRRSSVVRGLAVTPDGRHAVTAVGDGRLTLWDLSSGQARHTSEGHAGVVRAAVVTPEGDRAISVGDDGTLKVWDMHTLTPVATLTQPEAEEVSDSLRAVALMPQGRLLAGGDDGALSIWDWRAGTLVGRLPGHRFGVRGVAVTADGRLAFSVAIDRTVRVWDLHTGQERAASLPFMLEGAAVALEGTPRCLAIAPDGATIWVGDAAGNVYCLRYVGC